MSWWASGVSTAELGAGLGYGELAGAGLPGDSVPIPRGVEAPRPIEVPYDPGKSASERLGELAGCPSGYGVIYATPEYGDTLYTRKCRAVEATTAADIVRETQGGLSDRVLQTLFPTSDPGGPCATLDLACHLRGLRPYLLGGAILGGLFFVAYVVRAFK